MDTPSGIHAARPLFSLADLDYRLPEGLIAQEPPPQRDDARLLVLDRTSGRIEDSLVACLPDLLHAGDLLVVNDTKVLPARFSAYRPTGGRIEGLFVRENSPGDWVVMLRGSRRLRTGDRLSAGLDEAAGVWLELVESLGEGQWRVRVHARGTADEILERIGRAPLPPYIRRDDVHDERDPTDRIRYQTVFARHAGAVAAPTAGLHLTDTLLDRIRARGVDYATVTLHVGPGTFKPIQCDRIDKHRMHTEEFDLPESTAAAIHDCGERGGRVVAIGTTSVRVLESAATAESEVGVVKAGAGTTELFVYPPYRFRAVDVLLTNFHLPRSTLLALVMAFGGVDAVKRAYRHAVDHEYRFYSYGDAMIIK